MSTKSDLHNQLQDLMGEFKNRKVNEESTSKLNDLLKKAQAEGVISDDYAMDIDAKVTFLKKMVQTNSGEWLRYNGGLFPTPRIYQKSDGIAKGLVANNFVGYYRPTNDGPYFMLVHKDKAIDYLLARLEGDLVKIGMAPPGTYTRRTIEWLKSKSVEILQQVIISVVVAWILIYLIR